MPAFEALFTDGPAGRLFVVHHPPAEAGAQCVVIVPPFAEEMNKCRRQVALTARALRERGVATLIGDLSGTGDSDGAFGEATVERWCDDLDAIVAVARERGYRDITLLSLRAGALLTAAWLARGSLDPRGIVLWQPVVQGKLYVNQFLRLRTAAGMMAGGKGESVTALRERLAGGEAVEVAGYRLSPALIAGLDALNLASLVTRAPVHWITIGSGQSELGPANRRAADALVAAGTTLTCHGAVGEPFWSTVEIATAPEAIERTAAIVSEGT